MEGGSGGACTSWSMSTVSKEDNLVLSIEVSSYPDEAGLELGLGLSLGGGGGVKPQEQGWGQYGRILTAKDFPSTVSSSSSSSSSLSKANRTTAGIKRRADSVAASNSGRYDAFSLVVQNYIFDLCIFGIVSLFFDLIIWLNVFSIIIVHLFPPFL